MLARTVCETPFARAKFVRNSQFFPFFCDLCAKFAHMLSQKKFFKKKIRYFCRFYGRCRSSLQYKRARPTADPAIQAIEKANAPKKT